MTNAHPIEQRAIAVLAHREWIERLAARLVRDASRVDDLVQDTVAVALRKDPHVGVPLRSWLGAVLRNLYREGRRKSDRAEARDRTTARDASATDHTALLERADAHRALVEHVLSLGEVHRVILLQRYFDGLTPTEIAEAEGRTTSSVKSQLHRAHGALRARLEIRGGRDSWTLALGPLVPTVRKSWFSAPLAAAALVAGGGAALAMSYGAGKNPGVPAGVGLNPAQHIAALGLEPLAHGAPSLAAVPSSIQGDHARVIAATVSELGAFILDGAGEIVQGAAVRLRDADGGAWEAAADETGKIQLAGLPAGKELTATILIEGTVWAKDAHKLRLDPGENRSVSWSVHLTSYVSGVAMDEQGRTLALQWVQLTKTEEAKPIFETSNVIKKRFGAMQTDANGHFEFSSVPPGRYHIGALGELPRGQHFKRMIREDGKPYLLAQRQPTLDNCPVLHPIVVPTNEPDFEADITIYRGHNLKGLVHTPEGEPAPGVKIYAHMKGIENYRSATTGDDGRFSFGVVLDGEYTLTGQTVNDGWIFTGKVRTHSDVLDLKLEAVKTVEISGLVRRVDGEPVNCWIFLVRGVGTSREYVSVSIQRNGEGAQPFSLSGLPPGSYRLIYFCNLGEAYGSTDFQVGPEGLPVTGLSLRADVHAQMRLINRWPGRAAYVSIYDGDDLVMESWAEKGETKLVAVPTGKLRAVIDDPTHGGKRTVEFEAKAGEVADVIYIE